MSSAGWQEGRHEDRPFMGKLFGQTEAPMMISTMAPE